MIALTRIGGIGDVLAKKLIAYCGGPQEIFTQSRAALIKIPRIGRVLADAVKGSKVLNEAEKELVFAEKHGIRVLTFLDRDYPQRLGHCVDAPIVIFVKGPADMNPERVISIVGTRNATGYGKLHTEKLVEELAQFKVTIVSGLAYGIDVAAHSAALKYGSPTIACLAHGLDRLYPKLHANVARQIIEDGALLTDYPIGTNPDRENFPKRNRIIAGLSDATIVVEAGVKGGALITAELANGYNRDVFALPGRIGDRYSAGCNRLIRQNKAALITSGKDVLYAMRWDESPGKAKPVQAKLLLDLSPEQEKLVALMKDGAQPIDTLALNSRMPTSRLAAILLELEFDGIVMRLPGKMFRLV